MQFYFLVQCRFEKHFGKMADASLCVTRAMQHELAQNWGIKWDSQLKVQRCKIVAVNYVLI